MGRRKGKPTWQNMWHKSPENVSDKAFERWEELQEKISDGMQRTIDKLEMEMKHEHKLGEPRQIRSTLDLEMIDIYSSVIAFVRQIPRINKTEDDKLDALYDHFVMSDQG